MRSFGQHFFLAALLSLGMLFCSFDSASAAGGSWGGSLGGGSWGSHGGSWGSGGSHGGLFAGRAPVRNLLGRIGSRLANASMGSQGSGFGSYGSQGGSWGSMGSAGSHGYGSSGGFGSSGYVVTGGSYGSLGSGQIGWEDGLSGYSSPIETSYDASALNSETPSDSVLMEGYADGMGNPMDSAAEPASSSDLGRPTNPPTPPALPGPAADDSTSISRPDSQSLVLNLIVPQDARVYINGKLTQTPGKKRSYVSRNLKPDRVYRYHVKAVVVRDGTERTRNKMVAIETGKTQTLALDFSAPAATQLALNVPADAQVKLCGKETTAKGDVRHFATRKLAPGATWKDYRVEVTVERNGKILKQERKLDLLAGEVYSLSFDFPSDAPAVAVR